MNIYEEQELEKNLEEITSRIGYLILDLTLIALKKLNRENAIYNAIYKEFIEARLEADPDTEPLKNNRGSS